MMKCKIVDYKLRLTIRTSTNLEKVFVSPQTETSFYTFDKVNHTSVLVFNQMLYQLNSFFAVLKVEHLDAIFIYSRAQQ